MRAVAVVLGMLVLAGCGDAADASSGAGSRTSGGEGRLERARREMGLRDYVAEADAIDDRPVEFGPVRLPRYPHGVEPERAPLADGLELARAALALSRPEIDEHMSREAFQILVEDDYAAWLAERGQALGAARRALAAAEDGDPSERAVATAVIGVLFARFAEDVGTMPLPRVIRDDAADRLRFRDAFVRAAVPLYDRAADAFGACVSATVRARDHSLEPWQRFCDEQLERVQDAPRPLE